MVSHPGGWQVENRSSAGSETRIELVSVKLELILIAVLVIPQIEVHSGGCTKGVVRAGSEVVVAVFVLVSLAIVSAVPTLAIKAKTKNLMVMEVVYMDTG